VWIDREGQRGFDIIADAALATLDAAMVMIDIPIGLPQSGTRGCDHAARKLLPGAASRVFIGLRRPLLGFLADYAAANAWAKRDGAGLAKQAFHILPKIAAIDAFITPDKQACFRESHPELAFTRHNDGRPLPSKHTDEGLRLRRDLLLRFGFTAIDDWRASLRGLGAKPDDLYDACILAFAAREAVDGKSYSVDAPERRDARGLKMEIWY
jgi:predicted RNase H-like nuclease